MRAFQRRISAVVALAVFMLGQVPWRASAQEAPATPPSPAVEAIVQTISSGTQVLDAATLNSLSGLVVNSGATAVIDFGTGSVNFTGNLVNNGNLYFGSSLSGVDTASLTASNITNTQGALLSSILPTGGIAGFLSAVDNLSLSLTALQNIVNSGTITSAGNLSMVAGGSITNSGAVTAAQNLAVTSMIGSIVNSGTMAALNGNLNIASAAAQNLVVNNINGVMQALNGSINVRDGLFSGKSNLDIFGGDWLSKELNLYSGSGTINASVKQLTGQVNISAGAAHVLASTERLNLGNMTITGDPTFYNDAVDGDIEVTGTISAGEPLTLVATRDIFAIANRVIQANDGSNGQEINLIAGANITSAATTASTQVDGSGTSGSWSGTGTPATAGVTIDGPSASGGDISFGGVDVVIDASGAGVGGNGGTVRLIAYRSASSTGGHINFGSGSVIQTHGASGQDNGDVLILAGADNGSNSITLGAITASNDVGVNSVTIANAQPQFTNSTTSLTFGVNGAISSGNDFEASTSLGDRGMVFNGAITSGGTVDIASGNDSGIGINADITARNTINITANGSTSVSMQNFVVGTVNVGDEPTGVALNEAGSFAYVTNFLDDTVSVVDTSTNTVAATVAVGVRPFGVAVKPGGAFVYVANSSGDSISVIDTSDNTVSSTIPLGTRPEGVAFTPLGDFVYITCLDDNSVKVIRTSDNTVVETISVGVTPGGIAIDPSGRFAYVVNTNSNSVSVIRTEDNNVVTTLAVGSNPIGVAASPAGNFVYVTNQVSDNVSVIQVSDNTVVATLGAGDQPSGVSFNPAGTFAYVANFNSDNVTVIRTSDYSTVQTYSVGDAPIGFGNFSTFVGNNVTSYVSNSASDNLSVVRLPALVAPNVNLTGGTGDFTVGTSAGSGVGQGLTITSAGSASITEASALRVLGAAVTSGLLIGSYGTLRVTGQVTGTDITLQNGLRNGNMFVDNNITGSNTVTLSVGGNDGLIRQAAGTTIEATTSTLSINVAKLGFGSDEINLRSGDTFNLYAQVTGASVDIRTTNNTGSINLYGDVTSSGNILLSADGNGQVNTRQKVTRIVGVGGNPSAAAFSPDGSLAYVVNQADGTVSVFDTDGGSVTDTITVGPDPDFVVFNPLTPFAYVVNRGNNTITVINTDNNSTSTVVDPNSDLDTPAAMAVTADGLFAYVTNEGNDTVSIINLQTNTVVGSPITGFVAPRGIAIAPDGKYAYVANSDSGTNSVSVIVLATNTVDYTVPVGSEPVSVVANPNGRYIYVANTGDSSISVIDTNGDFVLTTFSLGNVPGTLGVSTQGTILYVNFPGANEVQMFETAGNTMVDQLSMNAPTANGAFVGVIGDRVTAYVPNFDNDTVSITRMTNLQGDTIFLESGGAGRINAATDTGAGTVGVGTAGSAFITGVGDVNLEESFVDDTLLVGSNANINVNGAILTSDTFLNVILQAPGRENFVQVNADIGDMTFPAYNVTLIASAEGGQVATAPSISIRADNDIDIYTRALALGEGSLMLSFGSQVISFNDLFLDGSGTIGTTDDDLYILGVDRVALGQEINWTISQGSMFMETPALLGPVNGTAQFNFDDSGACFCLEADGGSVRIGARTQDATTTIQFDVPSMTVSVEGPGVEIKVDPNTTLSSTGYMEFDLFQDSTFRNNGTVVSTASLNDVSIGIVSYTGELTVAGIGELDPGADNSVGIATLDDLVLANGVNQTVSSGNLLIESSDLKGADNGTATLAVTGGGNIQVGDDCGCVSDIAFRAVTAGATTTINLNAPTVDVAAHELNIHVNTTVSTSGDFNITLGDTSQPEGLLILDGTIRQTGAGTLDVSSLSGKGLTLFGSGTVLQDSPTPGFTALISDNQIKFANGLNLHFQSTSSFTAAPVYMDAPVFAVSGAGTATMTTDGGAFSIAPNAGAGNTEFALGTMNFNGGPLYVQANNIDVDLGVTVATDKYLGFILTDDGEFYNDGTIVATGTCAGCNGVNEFFLGFGDLELNGGSGIFSPGNQGIAFTVNNGFQLSLLAGLDWQMTSGGLAYFQGSTVRFGAFSLFRATNNATIAVSSPAGSDLTVVLPDNATAELRNAGGIMGIVPQTNGTSIFFQNSNLASINTAQMLLNTTSAAGAIYIGTFAPGSTNIAPVFNNVDINGTPNAPIYFGTVNGMTRSIMNTTAGPSLAPALGSPDDEDEGVAKDDLEPVAYMHGGATPLGEMLTEKQVAADALLTGRVKLEGQALATLRSRGVNAWQEGDAIRLDAGSLLIAPEHDVTVRTPEGDIYIDAGAAAYILASGRMVAVYNLHDEHSRSVRMEIAGERLSVHAGRHVVLTRNMLDGFGQVNPVGKLGYRQVKEHRLGNGLRAFQGEFSLVSALRAVGGARELIASGQGGHAGHRALSDRLMKTAAIQAYMTARNGAFASAAK